MNKIVNIGIMIVVLSCLACAESKKDADNPLMTRSSLPYQAPMFDKIKTHHFKPAIEQGMKEQLNELNKIINNSEAPTFENTVVALEKSGELLGRANAIFSVYSGAETNSEIQAVEVELAPKLAAHQDAIYLNSKLFDRIKQIFDNRNTLGLDGESLRLVEYYYERFLMAGANLEPENKEKLKKINEEESVLLAKFGNKLLDATNDGALIVDNKDELSGLNNADITKAADKAKSMGQDSKWALEISNTTQQSILPSLENRETRRRLIDASINRCSKKDVNDTGDIVLEIARLRLEKANLMGFPNYSSWILQDRMAKNPEAVDKMLDELIPYSVNAAKKDEAEMQKIANKTNNKHKIETYDWFYYAEKLRKEKYDLDENLIKPYFVLDSVLENGVFYSANVLYGITFKERTDFPVYNPDVRVFELFEESGETIGLFYFDPYKRASKSGGAWMSNMVEQTKLMGTKPVIYNVCNFNKPANGEAALISIDDVTTMFHEFGHALHGFFANQTYKSLSGTNVARDFVEYPSQFNEHWALEPMVLKNYAKHYKTGETLPQELLDRMKKSSSFNQGYSLSENLAAVTLDMAWHTIEKGHLPTDINDFENKALSLNHINIPQIPPRYKTPYFRHIWSNGYASGYYSYVWSEMLDADTYQYFKANGGMTRENGERYRKMVLSKGNTEDFEQLYKAYIGRMPNSLSVLKNRGIAQ